jgi:RimJ/RimL family protein N-acetyltransferase
MSSPTGAACTYWDPSECTGTPACPARCPRFVDREDVPLLVRPFRPEDREQLATRYADVDTGRRTMGLPPATAAKRERWLDRLTGDGWNLVAVHDDEVVGHVAAVPADADEPSIWVFVAEAWEGRGLGTELVSHVVAHAADRGYEALTLDVSTDNRRAVTVYKNMGFEVVELECYTYHMRLDLSGSMADRVQRPPAARER